MANALYGAEFIERLTSSGYKSTTYAIAEIVDNSVDAGASNIDIIFKEKEISKGSKKAIVIDEIIIIDDGSGMTEKRLNGCLTFSEGEGRNNRRIGAFGVGLPNSSINVGRRVDVYSRTEESLWNWVYLDIDEQKNREEPGYDKAVNKDPDLDRLIEKISTSGTIVKWSKLKKLEAAKASTLIDRSKMLLGRIYRYKLQEGLTITLSSYLTNNHKFTQEPIKILPNDPLYLMETKNYLTEFIWDQAQNSEEKDTDLGHLYQEFTVKYHYQKFIDGCVKNQTTKPLFQQFDQFSGVYTSKIGSKEYKWEMKASFASKHISNPGMEKGGGTKLGKEFGKKMNGSGNYKSGNIFFLRANREIDFGHFGLYTVTDEKNRFWTIEIHFDSDLDDLMGITNDKQSVKFDVVLQDDIEDINLFLDLPLGTQRAILYRDISREIKKAIKGMRKQLSGYAKSFQLDRSAKLQEVDEDEKLILVPEGPVIQVLNPTQNKWNEEDISVVTKELKSKFLHLDIKRLRGQVENWAKGLTQNVVLYAPNQTNNLFEQTHKRDIPITFINTNHIFYKNIIQPLKSKSHLKVFAVSIEMFIAAYSFEMDRLINENENKYEQVLDDLLLFLSSRLNSFIHDSQITINPKDFDFSENQEDELEE